MKETGRGSVDHRSGKAHDHRTLQGKDSVGGGKKWKKNRSTITGGRNLKAPKQQGSGEVPRRGAERDPGGAFQQWVGGGALSNRK